MERWLSVTVSEGKSLKIAPGKPLFFISIPKKIVHQAVQRNRVRRVLKEALRNQPFLDGTKFYIFKVVRRPEKVDLESMRLVVHELFGG